MNIGISDLSAIEKPRVLLIGDSISIGYTPFVKSMLSNTVEVVHAPGNNAATVVGLKNLDDWLGDKSWQVIHFNFGLHDMKSIDPSTADSNMAKMVSYEEGNSWVSLDKYETNLRLLVKRMKKSGATLIWCSTTPVPAGVTGRKPGNEIDYNAAALKVMNAEKVMINDLCAFVGTPEERLAMGGRPKDVHYTEKGSKALAGEVARAIEKALDCRR